MPNRTKPKQAKKTKPEAAEQTVTVGYLLDRLLDVDHLLSTVPFDGDGQEMLGEQEGFFVSQICKAKPATLGDCVVQLAIACNNANLLAGCPYHPAENTRLAEELSAVLARVLRFVAAEAKVELAPLAELFLNDNDHFPEYDDAGDVNDEPAADEAAEAA